MRIYTVVDDAAWCWATTAKEVAKNLPQHEFHITAKPSIEEAKDFDLIWMRGYPYLFPGIAKTGVPFVWAFTSGGDRAKAQFDKCKPYIRGAALIFCQNAEGMDIMRGAGAQRLALIPNGVDCDRFSPGPRPETFKVGLAANINGERWVNKGADVVVHACREAGIALAMATNPKPGMKPRVPEYSVGRVSHEEMPAFLQSLSVFCQPSTAEGCSNSIMEAMACGLPSIVCRESGYHGEVCTDGRTNQSGEALFVPAHDSSAVRDALEWLMDNPADIFRIGANARRWALTHSWAEIAKKYGEAFEEAALFMPEEIATPEKSSGEGEFHLVTFATRDYGDCVRLLMPTWVANSGAKSITLVSDGRIEGLPPEVLVRYEMNGHDFKENWIAGCMAKADAVARLLPEWPDGTRVVFLNADCAVVRSLWPLAAGESDLTLTRFSPNATMHGKHAGTCNIGAFSVTINERTRKLLALWGRVQAAYASVGHGITPGRVACDQYALTDIARGRACGVTVRNMDERVWNNSPDVAGEAWLVGIRRFKSAVIHFKGGRWRKPELVAKALAAGLAR